MEWIKQEISLFGGNPDNIQIGGESAGGGSVSSQMHYDARQTHDNRSNQLFHTVHAFSGNLYNPWSIGYPWQVEIWVNLTHQYLTEFLDDYSCDSSVNVKPCIKAYFKKIPV